MGLMDKLFGKNESAENIEKTAEMLDENLYWEIVARSLEETEDMDEQEEFLIQAIEQLTPTQIIGFRLRTDKLLYDTYTSEMWCAAYVINGGCSDDGFEYFRCWLISRGREVYYKAKEGPDSLMDILEDSEGDFEFESFWYVALEAFQNKTGKALYDYIDNDRFNYSEGKYPQFVFTWTEEDSESRKKICPKLFAHFESE